MIKLQLKQPQLRRFKMLVQITIQLWHLPAGKKLFTCNAKLLADDFGNFAFAAHAYTAAAIVQIATVGFPDFV